MSTKHIQWPWQVAKNARKWSVERDALGSTESVAIYDDDGKIVAFAVDYSNKAFADLNTDHARLIAAAPELLLALRYLFDCSAPMTPQQEECWKSIRVAIAKAEGAA